MTGWMGPPPADWCVVLERALAEDLGLGDLTAALFPADARVEGYIEAQSDGVLAGCGLAAGCLGTVAEVMVRAQDGERVEPGAVVLKFTGPVAAILSRERTALNFLMHLSGVATLTSKFVAEVAGTGCVVVDTRKTVPGLRSLQKYAVRCGGGQNHRFGLFDAAMLKDNHIRAAGSVAEAVRLLRGAIPHTAKIEVEADHPEQVDEAVDAGADIILLDNMPPALMAEIVRRHRSSTVRFEASGGVTLQSVREIAESGVHLVSVGALTHSAPSLALHLELR